MQRKEDQQQKQSLSLKFLGNIEGTHLKNAVPNYFEEP